MREINVSTLTDVIERLCIEANEHLPEDVKCAIRDCRACEDGEIAKGVLDNIIENFEIADNENVPIWHVYSLRSDRMYILSEETLQRQWMRAYAADMTKVICANPL